MAFLIESEALLGREFLQSPLRAGIPMDYPIHPFSRWIWGQGNSLPNIIATLLLFVDNRK
jgi:hypothetical protein